MYVCVCLCVSLSEMLDVWPFGAQMMLLPLASLTLHPVLVDLHVCYCLLLCFSMSSRQPNGLPASRRRSASFAERLRRAEVLVFPKFELL